MKRSRDNTRSTESAPLFSLSAPGSIYGGDGPLRNFKATPALHFQEVERELCRSLRHQSESTKQSGGISVTQSRLQSFLLARRSHDCWPAAPAHPPHAHSAPKAALLHTWVLLQHLTGSRPANTVSSRSRMCKNGQNIIFFP